MKKIEQKSFWSEKDEYRIKDIICDFVAVEPEEITPESKLLSDLGLSSLDLTMLSVEIEKEFGVTIPDDEAEKISTVGDAIAHIESLAKAE